MTVWSEKLRYRSHPPDPRLPEGTIGYVETRYPVAPQPSQQEYDPREFLFRIAPGWSRTNISPYTVPSEISRAGAEEEYRRYAFDRYRGIDSQESEAALVDKLSRSRWYLLTQPVWDGKTFSEVKREEPALFLKETSSGYIAEYDFGRWYSEKRSWEESQNLVLAKIKQGVTGFLNFPDPFFWVAAAKGEKAQHEFLGRQEYGHTKSFKEGKWLDVWAGVQVPAYTKIIIPFAFGKVLGAGFGSLKSTSIGSTSLFSIAGRTVTTGGLVEIGLGIGFGGLAVKETIPVVQTAVDTGDYSYLVGHLATLGMTAYFGYKGYKSGHAWGYGRTEAYLYGKHTYAPGSAESIRFKEALKVSRTLEDVRSHKMQSLDISKDIMRMDPFTADVTIEYLRSHPRTTIGGSAASYTQIVGARSPRDIDIFVRDRWDILFGTDKEVLSAKSFIGKTKTPGGQHLVDIHGIEMYKPGKYYRFGFVSKDPVRIGKLDFFRAGEQLFRKAESAVVLEKQFRWGEYPGFPKPEIGLVHGPKDIADFVTHAQSLISSAKQSWWTRLKVPSAEKHLSLFLDPEKSPGFGQATKWDTFISKHVKPAPSPKTVYQPGGYFDYIYPKATYPLSYTGMGVGSYFADKLKNSYKSPVKTGYRPVLDTYDYLQKRENTTPFDIPKLSRFQEKPKQYHWSPVTPLIAFYLEKQKYEPKKHKVRPPLINIPSFDGFKFKSIEELIKKRRMFGPSRWRIHPVEIDRRLLEVPLF